MFYVKTAKVGAFAQLAAETEVAVTLRSSLYPGLTRVDSPHDVRAYDLAAQVDGLPDTDQPRWLGDRRRAEDEDKNHEE